MDGILILKGLFLGMLVAMPVGPIGILCVHKTISKGKNYGYSAALGSATADIIFSTVVGISMGFIAEYILKYKFFINAASAFFLAFIGIKIFFMNPSDNEKEESKVNESSAFAAYLKVLFLTLLNPVSVLLFAALFTHLNISSHNLKIFHNIIQLIISIFLGSALCWYCTTSIVSRFREKMTEKTISKIEKVLGIVIIMLSIVSIIKFFIK